MPLGIDPQHNPSLLQLMNQACKNPRFVNRKDKIYGLTPLATAVILGDLQTVDKLLKLGADPRIGTKNKWTPLHLATVCKKEKIKASLLVVDQTHNYGLRELKNSCGATPSNLEEQQRFHPSDPDKAVISYQDEQGDIVPGTAAEFKKLTGAVFSNDIITTLKKQAGEWFLCKHTADSSEEKYLRGTYKRYQDNPPALYVAKGPTGVSLYANQTIHPGEIICHFSGIRSHENSLADELGRYKLKDLDASKIRNPASLADDGFPNAFPYKVKHVEGRYGGYHEVPVLIAIDEIHAGDPILWDYGNHTVKKRHLEINALGMKNYYLDNPLSSLAHECVSMLKTRRNRAFNVNSFINKGKIISAATYLLNAPSAVIQLLFNKTIKFNDLIQFQNIMFKQFPKEEFLLSFILGQIIDTHNIIKQIEDKTPELGEMLREKIVNITENYPYYVAFKLVFLYIKCEVNKITSDRIQYILDSIQSIVNVIDKFHSCVDSSNFDDFVEYMLLHNSLPDGFFHIVLIDLEKYAEDMYPSQLENFKEIVLSSMDKLLERCHRLGKDKPLDELKEHLIKMQIA